MAQAVRPGAVGDDLRARLRAALAVPADATSDFDLNPGTTPANAVLRPAAVLVAFRESDGQLILTKRASGLRHHPGQIALPGGKLDPGDADAVAAALREAREEIGLDPSSVEVLGALPPHHTVTGFSVTPVLSLIRGAFTPLAEPGEVEEAFWVPLAHVADPARYAIEKRQWRGAWRSYFVAPYGPYYIWGATARMLFALASRMVR